MKRDVSCTSEILKDLEKYCLKCDKCPLRKGAKQVVFGEGNPKADIMLIGEGPGKMEDELGRPFVGAAGQLLDKILASINLKREEVYIGNIVKCRPPRNRAPKPDEALKCIEYLEAQIAIIKPKIIILLGAVAVQFFLGYKGGITKIRGNWIKKQGFWIMPTFHPAALLRDPSKKRAVWVDFQKIQKKYVEIVKKD